MMAVTQAYVPLQFSQNNRFGDPNKDAKLINVYVESEGEDLNYTVKRPGFDKIFDFSSIEPETELDPEVPPRGLFRYADDLYHVFGPFVYRNDTFIYEITDGSFGTVYFSDLTIQFEDGSEEINPSFCFKTSKGLYIVHYDGNNDEVITEVTDADYPSDTVNGLVVLNGTIFVMNTNSEILNSDVNDPTSWDALDFITKEAEDDRPIAITKQRDLIIAFGSRSTEFFFDAGREPPGSPLQAQRNSFLAIGCPAPDSIVQTENSTVYVAEDQEGHRFVAGIQGTQYHPLSTVTEDRILSQALNIQDAYAWISESDGHKFYVLTVGDITLVYDITQKAWYTWTTDNDIILGVHAVKRFDRTVVQDRLALYEFASAFGTDDQKPIQVTIVTPPFGGYGTQNDMGMKNKVLSRLELIADYTGEGKVWVSWSDDDYKTWSRPRCLDLHRRDFLTRCGRFQRRAFRLQTEFPNLVRFRGLGLRMDVGTYGQ